jgi:hypothetical protein
LSETFSDALPTRPIGSCGRVVLGCVAIAPAAPLAAAAPMAKADAVLRKSLRVC